MARKHYKSRGNGSGGITYCKGKKKPYRVRVTDGFEYDDETGVAKQVLKSLGYYATKAEAEEVLIDYMSCPYDVENKDITFEEVYRMLVLEAYQQKQSEF